MPFIMSYPYVIEPPAVQEKTASKNSKQSVPYNVLGAFLQAFTVDDVFARKIK
jgi:hypothetical protein